MNQRRLSRVSMLAGAMALLGVIFLFYGLAIFGLLSGKTGLDAPLANSAVL